MRWGRDSVSPAASCSQLGQGREFKNSQWFFDLRHPHVDRQNFRSQFQLYLCRFSFRTFLKHAQCSADEQYQRLKKNSPIDFTGKLSKALTANTPNSSQQPILSTPSVGDCRSGRNRCRWLRWLTSQCNLPRFWCRDFLQIRDQLALKKVAIISPSNPKAVGVAGEVDSGADRLKLQVSQIRDLMCPDLIVAI